MTQQPGAVLAEALGLEPRNLYSLVVRATPSETIVVAHLRLRQQDLDLEPGVLVRHYRLEPIEEPT